MRLICCFCCCLFIVPNYSFMRFIVLCIWMLVFCLSLFHEVMFPFVSFFFSFVYFYYLFFWGPCENKLSVNLCFTLNKSDLDLNWTLVQSIWLFVPDPPPPPFVSTTGTQMWVHVKDPISIFRKRVSLTAGGMESRKQHTRGGNKIKQRWVVPYYGCSLSPPGKNPDFLVHSIGTRSLSNPI